MSAGNELLARYGHVRWLRLRAFSLLRQAHVAQWAFKVGDYVVREHCGACGQGHHAGIVTRVVRSRVRTYAYVRMACNTRNEDIKLDTHFLTHLLPPFPKEVLDLRHRMKRES